MLWAWHHFARKLSLDALEALLRCVMAGAGPEAGFGALDSITTGCGPRSRPPSAPGRTAGLHERVAEMPCLYESSLSLSLSLCIPVPLFGDLLGVRLCSFWSSLPTASDLAEAWPAQASADGAAGARARRGRAGPRLAHRRPAVWRGADDRRAHQPGAPVSRPARPRRL